MVAAAIVLLASSDATAENVLEGRCRMGTCTWLRIDVPEVVKSQASESLKKVTVLYGSSAHPNESYDKKTPVEWGAPKDLYALCSNTRPAIIHTDYSDKKKWIAQFLAPGYPDGVFGYLVETYVEYFKICHNIDPPRWGDIALARKFGYPASLVLRISNIPIVNPEDVMLARLPPPSANLREVASFKIKIVDFSWHKGGFDSVMITTFTVENNNPFSVKDITVSCVMKAPSGTILSEVRNTIYQTFSPNEQKTMRDFSMGLIHNQSERASCKVENWQEG